MCSWAAAQTAPEGATVTSDRLNSGQPSLYTAASPFRLFDPSRLQIGQSYSLSYFSGGPVGSQSVGVYTSSIGYRIADPLFVQLDLGVIHSPGALFGGEGRNLNAQIRPNFMLRYAPSNKFNLIVDVRTFPNYAPGYGFGYGRHDWRR
jgi:hypothetical protein